MKETYQCPYCSKPVIIEVDEQGRIESDPSYTLVADWIYHSECWDKQIEEHPP